MLVHAIPGLDADLLHQAVEPMQTLVRQRAQLDALISGTLHTSAVKAPSIAAAIT